jgi:FKBP-type peptidyl-prolyl cis-trans isomerase SlyD
MKVSHHKAVTVQYTLSDEAGSILDTSKGREPLTYIHGTSGLLPGFESALEGKSPEDSFSFILEPKDGYGERNETLIFTVPKERFAEVEDLKEGMHFSVNGPEGGLVMTVTGVGEADVTLDGNHPLAGTTLHFQVEVVEVRDATDEEIQESIAEAGCGCGADSHAGCGCDAESNAGCGCGECSE